MIKFVKIGLITGLMLLTGCTTVTNQNGLASMSDIVLAEPQGINYKSEIALARLSDVISRADINDAQRAQLFYDRGVIFDSVGLRSLARLDFSRALRLKPDFVEAYNFLGIQYTQLQEFNQAYESFDSALELAPDHEYAYLNRGIALYYGGRPQLAQQDLLKFYQYQKNDPYRVLWLYIVEHAINPEQAMKQLAMQAKQVDDKVWAKQIINVYLGKLSVSRFLHQLPLGINDNKALSDRLCEAYFYLAKYYMFQGQQQVAANYFKLALSTNVYEYVEHRYARLELDLMREKIALH